MAASTFTVTGTYTNAAGAPAAGSVTFTPVNAREVNTATIQDAQPIKVTLTNGTLSQVLVVNVGGYTVEEVITNATTPDISYVIPGLANIDLSTVNASLANFDASGVVNVVSATNVAGTTYTFVLANGSETIVRFTAATAVTATVDGSAAIPIGTVISCVQIGAGRVTVAGSNGAVIHAAGGLVTSRVQYSTFTLRKDTSTAWVLSGDLAA